MIFCIFYQVNWLGVDFLYRTSAEIGNYLHRKCKNKSFFIIEKIKKYRKCPALGNTVSQFFNRTLLKNSAISKVISQHPSIRRNKFAFLRSSVCLCQDIAEKLALKFCLNTRALCTTVYSLSIATIPFTLTAKSPCHIRAPFWAKCINKMVQIPRSRV